METGCIVIVVSMVVIVIVIAIAIIVIISSTMIYIVRYLKTPGYQMAFQG